jgi:RNA polymerase sigma-70 factor (ECF subfamily)
MDVSNFDKIVKELSPKLYNYIYKFVRNREDAEDILQSVFIAFHGKIEKVADKKVASYLYRSCHNKALDYLKKRNKVTLLDPNDFKNLTSKDSTEDDIAKERNAKLIQLALAKLPAKMAMLIDMKNFRYMSYKEISDETGLSIKAIESQLVRARKKMKKEIEKYKSLT